MSDKSKKTIEVEIKTLLLNAPTAFTDGVNIACRTDGGILLQFISTTPDAIHENFRTIMTKEGAIEFIDDLADSLDHYPIKKKTPSPRTKK
jgi:hypothetical protein